MAQWYDSFDKDNIVSVDGEPVQEQPNFDRRGIYVENIVHKDVPREDPSHDYPGSGKITTGASANSKTKPSWPSGGFKRN